MDAEPRRPPQLPRAGHKDQDGAGTAAIVVLRYGPQPVVERSAPQGETLAHDAEAASVVQGDGGVEAAPAVEFHAGPQPVDAGGHRGGEAVGGTHGVHPADEQRQPLPGHGVGAHEIRGCVEVEHPCGLPDAVGGDEVSLARWQVGRPVAHPPGDAVGQQAGQGAVNGGVRLPQNARQLRGVYEGRPAEDVEQLSV